MKNFFRKIASGFLLITLIVSFSWAQVSPAATAENTVDGVNIKIDYHSPKVKGRVIWGGLEQYDKVWRTGAEGATTIEVSENVKIGKNKMPKGKYALFTIPKKGDTWTVIFNKVADQWGAFNYDEKQDLFRIDVKVTRTLDINESLLFEIKDDGTVVFAWEYKSYQFIINK
jgi:hypothetical protein